MSVSCVSLLCQSPVSVSCVSLLCQSPVSVSRCPPLTSSAECNAVDVTNVLESACGTEVIYEPCNSVQCPSNSQCSRTVADCDFRSGPCGWNVPPWKVSADAAIVDTTPDEESNRYLLLEDGATGTATSPWLPTSLYGFNCVLEMRVYTDDVDTSTFAVHVFNSSSIEESDTWRGRLVSKRWQVVRVPIHPYDSNVSVHVVGTAPTAGAIAIDDIELVCGSATEGDCRCEPGFIDVDNSTNGVVCRVDPDETGPTQFPPVVGIDTCLL